MINLKNTKTIDNAVMILVLAVIVLVFFGLYKWFKGFAAMKDGVMSIFGAGKDDDKVKAELSKAVANLTKANDKNPFSPNFFNLFKGKKVHQLSKASATKIAKELYDSVGLIKDNPQRMLSIFQKLQYQTHVSSMADAFQKAYGIALLVWLTDKFDTKAQKEYLQKAIEYVLKLPVGNISNYEGEASNYHVSRFKDYAKATTGNVSAAQKYNRYLTKIGQAQMSFDDDGV